jgi:hypothetical protein
MLWRTFFERINCDFVPALRQTADVVFETAIPFDNYDDNPEKFEQAAWDAMWQQNPHWLDPKGPTPTSKGWSSVMGGYKFEQVVPR